MFLEGQRITPLSDLDMKIWEIIQSQASKSPLKAKASVKTESQHSVNLPSTSGIQGPKKVKCEKPDTTISLLSSDEEVEQPVAKKPKKKAIPSLGSISSQGKPHTFI